jgi:enoyl-CoA hydratase
MSDFEHLEIERLASGVVLARLNRPQVLNAVNTRLGSEILRFFSDINSDRPDTPRCIVMTGAGERAFCVGGDLKERNGMSNEEWHSQRVIFRQYNQAMERCPVPIICAVNGLALGGGAEMVMRADFSYAAEHARFGFPEVKRGFMPGSGGTQRLARLAGEARAKELILTGEQFSAAEAHAWGMINRILPRDELLAVALKTATQIAEFPATAVRTIKQVIQTGLQADLHTGLIIEALGHQRLTSSEDRLEGVAAFVEKREPNWTRR